MGAENLHSLDQVVEVLVDMRSQRPTMISAIVKLDEGVSGEGNALVDLSGLPPPGSPNERHDLRQRVDAMQLEAPDTPLDVYLAKFAEGGIVEERMVGAEVRSPSVQLRTLPGGRVEILSTHDQMLGGAAGRAISVACSRRPPSMRGPSPSMPR